MTLATLLAADEVSQSRKPGFRKTAAVVGRLAPGWARDPFARWSTSTAAQEQNGPVFGVAMPEVLLEKAGLLRQVLRMLRSDAASLSGTRHDQSLEATPVPSSAAFERRLRAAGGAPQQPRYALSSHALQCSYTKNMAELTFEWDSRKAAESERKHRISFDEAKTAFLAENARVTPDPEHSEDKDRFVLLGLSIKLLLLVVAPAYRESDQVIRLISARKADPGDSDEN